MIEDERRSKIYSAHEALKLLQIGATAAPDTDLALAGAKMAESIKDM